MTTDVDPDNAGTGYHESLDHLRRELMGEHWNFQDLGRKASKAMDDENGKRLENPPEWASAAYLGCILASGYAYALAGVLEHVRREHGEEAARVAGVYVDCTLANGDDADYNKDVDPKPRDEKGRIVSDGD